jgi:hypothetical protein
VHDAGLSFYSGHAALSFAAAVSGSYLYARRTPDARARALMWGVELGLATATANLRVRAGRHFYSDVLVGALLGSAAGVAVPLLHSEPGHRYRPSGADAAAMAAGVSAGALVSQLVPLHRSRRVALTPVPVRGGFGLAGRFSSAPRCHW